MGRVVGRVLAERRIYVRSDAGTTYWTLSPLSQVTAALIGACLIAWSGFTSYVFIDGAMDQRSALRRLEAMRETHDVQLGALQGQQRLLEEELNRSTLRGDEVTAELSAKQRILVETATKLQAAEVELSGLRASYMELVAERRQDAERIDALNEEITSLRLAMAGSVKRGAADAMAMDTLARTMDSVIAARDAAASRAARLDGRVAELEVEVAGWHHRQETLLAQLEEATRTSLTSLNGLFVNTEVDLDSILRQTKRDYTGRGGPEQDDERAGDDAAEIQDSQRVAALMTDLERMSMMRVAIDRLPFGVPTRGAERTSGFGPRRDPYRRSSRMHNGVDFAAPRGTPIYSTAEGVVTFAGRQAGYGIVVKIRHAFGFETVYAHLSKSRVEVGQRVSRGDRIADMGSTGRSTGSHLHYEVRIDGLPVNPSKFIGAARNVL